MNHSLDPRPPWNSGAKRTMNRALTMTGELAHKIAEGKKVVHLHPARYNKRFALYYKCPFPIGTSFPVVRDTDPDKPVLHVQVTKVRLITLRQLTSEQIRELAHRTLYDMQASWMRRHDRHALLDDPVIAVARYAQRWEGRAVWLLDIRPSEAPPTWMARKPPSETAEEGDYTTDPRLALDVDAEVVPTEYQNKISHEAFVKYDLLRRARGEGKDGRNAKRAADWRVAA